MASDVQIVNNALSLLGDDPITALTDDTERARLANRIFAPARDAVLRSHPWNCAVQRAILAQISPAPDFGWAYQYQLPTDPFCLRVLALNDDEETGDSGDDFKVEGQKLLTDAGEANIRYIGRITDPALYDGLLYWALSYHLAAIMAYPITGSTTVTQGMVALYEQKIREARAVDGQEGSAESQVDTSLIDCR